MLIFRFVASPLEASSIPGYREQARLPAPQYVHVGYVNFSTWHFACLQVQQVSQDDCHLFLAAMDPHVLHVKVPTLAEAGYWNSVLSDVQYFKANLDLTFSWHF